MAPAPPQKKKLLITVLALLVLARLRRVFLQHDFHVFAGIRMSALSPTNLLGSNALSAAKEWDEQPVQGPRPTELSNVDGSRA